MQDPQVDHHEVRNPAILAATITLEAFEELRLRVGQEACAVIKVRSTFALPLWRDRRANHGRTRISAQRLTVTLYLVEYIAQES